MAYGYSYGGYPGAGGGYYAPPMPDQLAQLRQGPFQQTMQQTPINASVPPQQTMQANTMQQPIQTAPVQQNTISGPVYVNGEAGAKGYLVAPNNTVILFDADPDAHTFWLKSADTAGMPSMRTFDYTERIAVKTDGSNDKTDTTKGADYVTREEWNDLKERADSLAAELEALKAKKTAPVKKTAKEDEE